MNYQIIEQILKDEPAFRHKQVWRLVFFNLIEFWVEATSLSKKLREELQNKCSLTIDSKIYWSQNKQSAKAVIKLADGNFIETVLIRHKNGRNTVCVSSQVGCTLGCDFCATGKGGFLRNLTAFEILEQVLLFARLLKKQNEKITNVVFMGMGEPFLNYDNVMQALNWLNDSAKFNIGARHLSVSTVGIVPGIKKFTEAHTQYNLAISIHAPNNKLRNQLMPINKKYPLEKILTAAADYLKKNRRRLMIEYVMLKGINDSVKHAQELASLLKKYLPDLYFVNLISYNPTGKYLPSTPTQVKKFKNVLMQVGISTIQRFSFGRDIKAACGQLVKNKINKI